MVDFPLRQLPPPAARPRRKSFRALKALAFGAAVVFALLCLLALKLASGLPEKWAEFIGEKASSGGYDIEPSRVSFSLARLSLRVGSLGVYEKRVVRAPLAKASGIEVRLRPRSFVPSPAWLSSVRVDSLELGIDLEGGGDGEETCKAGAGGPKIPDVPPFAFSCGRVDVLGFRGRDVSATVRCSGGALLVDGAKVSFPDEKAASQRMEGSLSVRPSPLALSAEGAGRFDPNLVVPLLKALDETSIAAELEKFVFRGEAPAVAVSWAYDPARDERRLRIDVESGPAEYNGVAVDGFSGVVSVGNVANWARVRVSQLSVSRPEGTATGELDLRPREDALEFSAAATMDPLAVAAMVGLVDAGADMPLSFPVPAQARADGTLSLGPAATSDLKVSAFAPRIEVCGASLSRASAEMTLRGDALAVEDCRADVLGGGLSGSFSLVLPRSEAAPTNFPCALSVKLDDISWQELAKLRDPGSRLASKGRLDASLSLEGPLDDICGRTFAQATGTLAVDARDSRVFRVPAFAGLTDILARVVPGVDWLLDEDNFSVRGSFGGGKLRIDPFKIDGAAVSLSGKGNVFFPDLSLDLKVKAHLLNRSTWLGEGVYWLLSPLSKMFEIRATGPAASPRWTSATFQSDPAKK